MNRQIGLLVLLMLVAWQTMAQEGGKHVYQFLHLPISARVNSLGGNLITVADGDINLAFANPSLLNKESHKSIAFSHGFFFGASHSYVAYAWDKPTWKTTFHSSLQYLSQGDLDQTDNLGQVTGTFKPADYSLTLGGSYHLYPQFSIGANLRFIGSQLEAYKSYGVGVDLGATYIKEEKKLTYALVVRNIGTQLKTYTDDNREIFPMEIQFGVSKELAHLPLRFSVIFQHAEQWNIRYDDPALREVNIFDEEPEQESAFSEFTNTLIRHFIVNSELMLGKKRNFRVRLGYNFLRGQEMKLSNLRSVAGFSYGLGIKVNRFRIDFGRSSYSLGEGYNHLSISTNLKEFSKKKK